MPFATGIFWADGRQPGSWVVPSLTSECPVICPESRIDPAESSVNTTRLLIHPLIDRRRLFADSLERRMRVEEREHRRQAVIGDPVHADLPVVVRNVFTGELAFPIWRI